MLVFTRFIVHMWYVVITIMVGPFRDIIIVSYLKALITNEISNYIGD